jgi:hypothetical protein
MEPSLDIPPQFILMILTIALLIAGFIALALVFYFIRSRRKKKNAAEITAMPSGSANKTPGPAAAIPQPLPAAAINRTSADGEILKIMRGSDNSLLLQMEGKTYRTIGEIVDPQMGQRLLLIFGELLTFSRGMIATADGLRHLDVGGKAGGLSAMPPAPPLSGQAPRKGKEIKSASPQETSAQTLDLINEIDEFVQRRLKASPYADKVSLQLRAGPQSELLIDLNGHYYHSPAEVTDENIRALIQAAVKDWEVERG